MNKSKYIFLDRDGVINQDSSDYIKTANEWKPIHNSLEAIKNLTEQDFHIIIITNQSGINRNLITPHDFVNINVKMLESIDKVGGLITSIIFCPSLPTDKCTNRKPYPGMFYEIAERLDIKLSDCFSIGDSPRDIEASIAAKCKPLGVRTGNGGDIEKNNKYKVPMFDDLYHAVKFVIAQK